MEKIKCHAIFQAVLLSVVNWTEISTKYIWGAFD